MASGTPRASASSTSCSRTSAKRSSGAGAVARANHASISGGNITPRRAARVDAGSSAPFATREARAIALPSARASSAQYGWPTSSV